MTADCEDLDIEECAVRSWPALVTGESGGWLLRATPGVDRRRSNSAVPPRSPGSNPGSDLDRVEEFYRRRGSDAVIQVGPAHRHHGLDRYLAARGYEVESPTLVLRVRLTVPGPGEPTLPVTGSVRPGWFHVEHGHRDREWTLAHDAITGRDDASAELVLDRIPGRTSFARALHGRAVLGVGFGVLDTVAPKLGIFAMGTAVQHRGKGVAGAVLSALLRWGAAAGATSAWLQVEESNHAARGLYAAHGFVLSHRYHYRRRAL